MKIIDQTPFFTESGTISVIDRGKAIMRFGPTWFKEIEAQKQVMLLLDTMLDKNYTLLRNVTPPGLETSIPFILVGPTGVYVMYVTHLTGMFRAKGDIWGTISGNAFKPEKPNLLTRTERMARAVEMYLKRQGYTELSSIDAILLCADPSVHVDSLRPIVRIVMRDALERFAVSITQQRVLFSPEAVQDVVTRILTPPRPEPEAVPEIQPQEVAGDEIPIQLTADTAPSPAHRPSADAGKPVIRRQAMFSKKQIIFLVAMFIMWCLIVAGFVFLVVQDTFL
jgi:hypothetical protein